MVIEPRGFGLIVQRGPRTRVLLKRLEDLPPSRREDDGHLVACAVGGSPEALSAWLSIAETSGAEAFTDFVVTRNGEGIQGDRPSWLAFELEPSGDPPALEAGMEPEVREMWQRNRRRTYALGSAGVVRFP